MAVPQTPEARRELLTDVYRRARTCERCPHLAATRTQVVFGAGNADSDVMFVGEAPGADEDREGVPFVGRAGRLLTELLGQIGLAREDVFIANVLKCRPPENRNPTAQEVESCSGWLFSQLELVQPAVVVTLGNYATRLLRGDPTSITRIRGQAEVRVIGPRAVRLLPVLHPAAALYTPSNRALLEADFALLPALVGLGAPPQPGENDQDAEIAEARELLAAEPAPEPTPEPPVAAGAVGEEQLGLF
jgi:DNA polymerase